MTGDRILESPFVSPASPAIRMMPVQRHIAPSSKSTVSTACLAPSAAAAESAVHLPVHTAPTNASTIIAIQMPFSIPSAPFILFLCGKLQSFD